jgi:hypothetical protein
MIKSFTLVLGVVLLGVGVFGYATGGHDHLLLSIFGINMTHNLVHILSGAAAIGLAMAGPKTAKMFCLAFGVVYGLVAVAGFANVSQAVSMLNLNQADNLLHTAIAGACLFMGATAKV